MAVDKLTASSVGAVWLAVAVAAIVVLVAVPSPLRLASLSIVLAGGVVLAFCIQLSLNRKEGLVSRIAATVGGSVVLLALATIVAWMLG